MNSAAATEAFPAILRESVGDLMSTVHRSSSLREVQTPTYGGETFTQYVWVCSCGQEARSPMPKASANRGHGLHLSAAMRRLDKAQDAAIATLTSEQTDAYMAWLQDRMAAAKAAL